MDDKIECGEYIIEQIETEREFNYIVRKEGDYICRLVPGYTGFELSPLDKAVENFVDDSLIEQFGKRISDFYD